jgi:hypothetical protein
MALAGVSEVAMITVVCRLESCPRYRLPMTVRHEFDSAWTFWCPDHKAAPTGCGNVRVVTKDKFGDRSTNGRKGDGTKRWIGKGITYAHE